jgi:hypothetical protein
MTQDDIIKMAAQVGAYWQHGDFNMPSAVMFDREDMLIRFAQLVAAHEREACCKTIDEIDDGESPEYRACQEAIRARGSK